MTQSTLNRRFASAALALGALSAGSAAADNTIEVAGVQSGLLLARDPAPTPAVMQLEMDFLNGMIPHHRQGVGFAGMALEKAVHPELRQFAQQLKMKQEMHIEKMSKFLRDWYGHLAPEAAGAPEASMDKIDMPLMHGDMPDFASRTVMLKMAEGPQFDVEFMNTMSVHHATGIAMAAPVLIDAHHEDLHHLAQDLVIEQGVEIKQLDRWLKAWYGVARAS